jgi:antitoxin component YwqK of YwqJK toxin-antitoxin module
MEKLIVTILHDAYAALLSGLTYKTGNKIHWKDENGNPITVEPINIKKCKYIVRYYYSNGNKKFKYKYQKERLHGKSADWYTSGNKKWEQEHKKGKLNGKSIVWYENGNKQCELEYQDNNLNGKFINWDRNGIKYSEGKYKDGKIINK